MRFHRICLSKQGIAIKENFEKRMWLETNHSVNILFKMVDIHAGINS